MVITNNRGRKPVPKIIHDQVLLEQEGRCNTKGPTLSEIAH